MLDITMHKGSEKLVETRWVNFQRKDIPSLIFAIHEGFHVWRDDTSRRLDSAAHSYAPSYSSACFCTLIRWLDKAGRFKRIGQTREIEFAKWSARHAGFMVDKSKTHRIRENRASTNGAFADAFREIRRNSIFLSACQSIFPSCRNSQRNKVRARADPSRRLGNIRNHLAMFHLDGRDAKHDSSSLSNERKNFSWWLHDRKIEMSPVSDQNEDHRSSESPCVNSDELDSYSFVQNVLRQECENEISEKIELTSFAEDYFDVDLIEDASGKVNIIRWPSLSLYVIAFAHVWHMIEVSVVYL